jgi:hypothetical protein
VRRLVALGLLLSVALLGHGARAAEVETLRQA